MLIRKNKFPAVDELVLVTVTKVNPNSVFTVLDEYNKITALIHISEISPGRIRNIRDYVVEGKKIICKVLKIDEQKGHIDLSLRRVTEIQRRNKGDEIKQEQKAQQLFDFFVKENKIDKKTQDLFIKNLNREYDSAFDFYTDIVENQIKVSEVIDDKKFADKFEEFIKEKIKPAEVLIEGKISLTLFDDDGVEKIKKIFKKILDEETTINYLGSGAYSIKVKSKEFKDAEKLLKNKLQYIEDETDKLKGIFSFTKKE